MPTRGAVKSLFDLRDHKIETSCCYDPESYTLPDFEEVVEVKDQGNVSSCVAFACSSILEYFFWREYSYHKLISTDFIYRIRGKYLNSYGLGMTLRGACKILKNIGSIPKQYLPSNTEMREVSSLAEDAEKKSDPYCWIKTRAFAVSSYQRLSDEKEIKQALCQGSPVLASIKWYDGMDVGDDGETLVNNKTGDSDYHAFVIYGYDEKGFKCLNSWGRSFGRKGKFYLPYSIKVNEAWSFIDETVDKGDLPEGESQVKTLLTKIINFMINLILLRFRKG